MTNSVDAMLDRGTELGGATRRRSGTVVTGGGATAIVRVDGSPDGAISASVVAGLYVQGGDRVWVDFLRPKGALISAIAAPREWLIIGEDIPIGAGWEAAGIGNYGPPRFRRLPSGMVIFSGTLTRVSGTGTMFTVPEPYAPGYRKTFKVHSGASQGSTVFMGPDGVLTWLSDGFGSTTGVVLNSIFYLAGE